MAHFLEPSFHLPRPLYPHLPFELEHPTEEDIADLDRDLCAKGGIIDALDLGILAEFVIDAAEERLIEPQGHP